MTAALSLAQGGYPVVLVEREAELGGNLRHEQISLPGQNGAPQETLRRLVQQVNDNEKITVHLEARVIGASGFMGNFSSTLELADGRKRDISHGVTILATGAEEYHGPEYGYGSHPQVVTQMEFERLLADGSTKELPQRVVMIQCVGPGEKFCSRICCTVALKNAIALKECKPEAEIIILYRDMRAYGFKERLYTQARQLGVSFIRYDPQRKPQVDTGQTALTVSAWEPILARTLDLHPDLLVLSMPAVPPAETHHLAALFNVPVDADGFFLEAHVKLRPVDFATDGVFMAGMAHYPKLLDESIIQAQAAAARASRILSRDTLLAGGRVAVVDPDRCTGCLTCVRICPFNVPLIQTDLSGVGGILGAAYIEAAVCQGCGQCAAECPARAIQLMHYTDAQMMAKVRALVQPQEGFVPLAAVTDAG
jgi:heterodisulfide reductase subunit A-like polyferredoxin